MWPGHDRTVREPTGRAGVFACLPESSRPQPAEGDVSGQPDPEKPAAAGRPKWVIFRHGHGRKTGQRCGLPSVPLSGLPEPFWFRSGIHMCPRRPAARRPTPETAWGGSIGLAHRLHSGAPIVISNGSRTVPTGEHPRRLVSSIAQPPDGGGALARPARGRDLRSQRPRSSSAAVIRSAMRPARPSVSATARASRSFISRYSWA